MAQQLPNPSGELNSNFPTPDGLEDGEPYYVIPGHIRMSAGFLELWASELETRGEGSPEDISDARRVADEIRDWRQKRGLDE